MNSLQGQLLVAVPQLPDANFHRTVVLMLQHDDQGAVGLILNRSTPIELREVWKEITGREVAVSGPIFIGGPVEGPLMALHTSEALADAPVFEGLYVTSQKPKLESLVDRAEHPLRLYTGYSGWGAGQLEGELAAGGWFITQASLPVVFAEDEASVWKQVAEGIGRNIAFGDIDERLIPPDPSLN